MGTLIIIVILIIATLTWYVYLVPKVWLYNAVGFNGTPKGLRMGETLTGTEASSLNNKRMSIKVAYGFKLVLKDIEGNVVSTIRESVDNVQFDNLGIKTATVGINLPNM